MKKTPTAPARCFVFAIASLALGLALTVSAATPVSWAVNGGGSWNAPGNWDPATVPNGAGEFAVLTNNVVATAIVTNDVNVTLGTLWIGPLDNVANYTITNNPGIGLTFDNSGSGAQIIQLTGSASSDRVYPPIALADNLTITNDTSKVLQLYGIISDSGGARTITKAGAGQLTLAGTGNSFSGGLIVKGGLANIAAGSASKAGTGPITLGDTSGSSSAQLLASANCTNAITVVAGSTGTKTMRNAGTSAAATFSGPISLQDNVVFNAGSSTVSTTVSGVVSGSGAVTNSGSSTAGIFIALTGNNSFGGGLTLQSGTTRIGNANAPGTGTLTINGGTLSSSSSAAYTLTNPVVVGGNFTVGEAATGTGNLTLSGTINLGSATRTVTVNNAGADIFSGMISGDAGVGIVKAGTGSLSFNAANTYPGGTTVNAGTMGCGNASSLGTGSVTLGATSGTATATLTGSGTTITNDITVAAGGTGLRAIRNNGTAATIFSGPIILNSDLTGTTAAGGSTTLSGEISGPGVFTVSRDATVSANGVTLAHSNSFSGGVLLTKGTLRVGNDAALGTGTLTISDGTTFCSNGSSHRDPTNAVVVNGNFTIGQPVAIGAGSINFFGPMDLGADTRTLTLSNTVSDRILGAISGAGGLVKTGAVALYLSGTNTFAGGLTVKESSVVLSNGFAAGTGLITLGDDASTNSVSLWCDGALTNDLVVVAGTGGTRTLRVLSSGATLLCSGGITLNSNLTVNCPTDGTTLVLSGVVGGTAGLQATATRPTNMIVLTAANTYAGDTIVTSGTMVVTNATGSGTGSGNITVQTGATLAILGGVSGNVTVESGGVLAGKGGSIGGAVTVNDGAYLVPGLGLNDIGTLNINNSLTLAANSTTLIDLDRGNGTNDAIKGVTTLTYGGTLTVNNLSGSFTGGETYQLFSASTYVPGDFAITNLPSLSGGLSWAWNAANGTLSVVSGGIPSTPTNISYSVSGTNLNLTWPASYAGWFAQSNAVSVASSNSWHDIPDSDSVTSLSLPISPAVPEVFYRLRKP